MNSQTPKDPLTTAYLMMLEQLHLLIGQPGNRMLALQNDLEFVREKCIELSELTQEEVEKIAIYLERDLHDAAVFLTETGQELHQWWQFDVQQVEAHLFKMFSNVADQASLQLHAFNEKLRQSALYKAGEITGPGTLVCQNCGETQHFMAPALIKPCVKCAATEFQRILSIK
ncbi:hypothetical protein TI05_09670 [Achromatium sp. WMS3]|nr:hypothetical protein TI05_09670 [Achromatium sp. WMS3]